ERQTLAAPGRRLRIVTLTVRDLCQEDELLPDLSRAMHFPTDSQAFLQERGSRSPITSRSCHPGQVFKGTGDADRMMRLTMERQALLEEPAGRLAVALVLGQEPQVEEGR